MWVILLLVLLGGLALLLVGILGLFDRLPRNKWAGIRTRSTMESDDAWFRAHRAAAPILLVGSVAIVAVSLAFLPFAAADKLSDGIVAAVAIMGMFLVLMTAVSAMLVGSRAAEAASPGA